MSNELIKESIRFLNKKTHWNTQRISENVFSAKKDIISSLEYNSILEKYEDVEGYFFEDIELIQIKYDLTEEQIYAIYESVVAEGLIDGIARLIPRIFKPKIPKVPGTPKAPKAPEISKAPEAPKAPKAPKESPGTQARKQELETRRMEREQRAQQRKAEAQQRKAEVQKKPVQEPVKPVKAPPKPPGKVANALGNALTGAAIIGTGAAVLGKDKSSEPDKGQGYPSSDTGSSSTSKPDNNLSPDKKKEYDDKMNKPVTPGGQSSADIHNAMKDLSQEDPEAAAAKRAFANKQSSYEKTARDMLAIRNKHTGIDSDIDATINKLKKDDRPDTWKNFIRQQGDENISLGVGK